MLERLKNILPITKRHFNYITEEISQSLKDINQNILNVDNRDKELRLELKKLFGRQEALALKISEIEKMQNKFKVNYDLMYNHIDKDLKDLKDTKNTLAQKFELVKKDFKTTAADQKQLVKDVDTKIDLSKRTIDEILWAQVFNNTVAESEWLKQKAFSPGHWAVGYDYLYVLYRALNIMQPEHILELGLGQSTRLISQYASWKKAQHEVVEHDERWIEFFKSDFSLTEQTHIVTLELTEKPFLDDEKVLEYKDFQKTFEGRKFDFISIDAPFGGQANIYARVDIVDLLPDCLNDSFVILIDDFNRKGERCTAKIIEKKLTDCSVPFCKGIYRGEKYVYVIVSENLNFLCTM